MVKVKNLSDYIIDEDIVIELYTHKVEELQNSSEMHRGTGYKTTEWKNEWDGTDFNEQYDWIGDKIWYNRVYQKGLNQVRKYLKDKDILYIYVSFDHTETNGTKNDLDGTIVISHKKEQAKEYNERNFNTEEKLIEEKPLIDEEKRLYERKIAILQQMTNLQLMLYRLDDELKKLREEVNKI